MNVSCRELVPIIKVALSAGSRVQFTATGGSMIPFIRSGETVELAEVQPGQIALGDVLLALRPDGVYVLHRVAAIGDEGVLMVSDAGRTDGWIPMQDVVARATAVYRRGRRHELDTASARRMGLIWMRLGSFATGALAVYLALRRRFRPGGRAQGCDQNPA